MSSERGTWAVYVDVARMNIDCVDEGPNPAGAIGSNWQPGWTKTDAEAEVATAEAEGWTRWHDTSPRF